MNSEKQFRKMRRSAQALSVEECEGILASAKRGTLAVIGYRDYPYSIPINFLYDDGRLFFHCARKGHKLDAIRICDKACFTVIDEPVKERGEWWYHVRSVICFGRVRLMEGEDKMERLRQLGEKYFPEGYDIEGDLLKNGPRAEVIEFIIEYMSGKRVKEK